MKTTMLVTACLLITSVAHGQDVYQVSPSVSDGKLNIRDGPGTNHQLLGTMPAGTVVNVYGCVRRDDGINGAPFCQVTWQGIHGWASTADMVPTSQQQQTQTPPPPTQEQSFDITIRGRQSQ
jgi:uncharacterized protein YraI